MSAAHAVADTAALTGRSLRHILRSPDTIVTTAVTPIAHDAAVRLRPGRRDRDRLGRALRDLPAAGHPADDHRLGRRLHVVPALPRPPGRHRRALPVDADRPVRGAVGPRADLVGRQRRLPRHRRGGRAADGLPLGRGRAGLAGRGGDPAAVHRGPDLAGGRGRAVGEDRGRRERVQLPADLPSVHQLGLRARPTRCRARWRGSPSTSPSPRSSTRSGPSSTRQPAGGDLWVALAWCVGLLVVAYAWANATYRRRLR